MHARCCLRKITCRFLLRARCCSFIKTTCRLISKILLSFIFVDDMSLLIYIITHVWRKRAKEIERESEKMEASAVFGGGRGCLLSSSSIRSSQAERTRSLSCSHNPILRTQYGHLSAFSSKTHLFCSRTHAKTKNKTHIFLPHLVAALVWLSLSSIFFLPRFQKPICGFISFLHIYRILDLTVKKFHCLNVLVFIDFYFFIFFIAGTSWRDLHNGETRWGSTWPCKSFISNFSYVILKGPVYNFCCLRSVWFRGKFEIF